MDILSRFAAVGKADKAHAVRTLVEDSTPDFDFFFMITLAVLMATFGLLAGSETIVIGSMLIAPLLYPVLGLSLGISMSDQNFVKRSVVTLIKATIVAILSAVVATILFSFSNYGGMNDIIASRTEPSLMFLIVGVISGIAVAYSLVRPRLSETLPAVAVSVALIPPLAVVGIGIVWVDAQVLIGALTMFLVNVLGVVAAAVVSFSLMDVHGERTIAERVIVKEDKRVEKEEAHVKEVAVEKAEKTIVEDSATK